MTGWRVSDPERSFRIVEQIPVIEDAAQLRDLEAAEPGHGHAILVFHVERLLRRDVEGERARHVRRRVAGNLVHPDTMAIGSADLDIRGGQRIIDHRGGEENAHAVQRIEVGVRNGRREIGLGEVNLRAGLHDPDLAPHGRAPVLVPTIALVPVVAGAWDETDHRRALVFCVIEMKNEAEIIAPGGGDIVIRRSNVPRGVPSPERLVVLYAPLNRW
ncbi:MAG: hypothetical protein QM796_17740 [Chthoniobacteraceae bacterium]